MAFPFTAQSGHRIARLLSQLVLLLLLHGAFAGEDYYELLGIPRDADDRTIRKAFKKLAIQKHPDKHPDNKEAHAEFVKLNRAYEVLKDEQLRKKYDEFGEEGLSDDHHGGQQYQSWQFYNENFGIYDDDPEIITLSRADFERTVLESGEVWFVNFYSTFCSHCHQLAPVWRKFAREMFGAIRIGAVNCAEDPMLCQSQNVMGYPSLVMFPQRVFFNGVRDLEILVDFAMKYLKSEVFHLNMENYKALSEEFPEYSGKPWVIDFCDDTDRCLDKNNRRKLASMLDGLANVGTIHCFYGEDGKGKDKLCDLLGRTDGVVYYPAGLLEEDEGKVLDTLDTREIADKVLTFLPDLQTANGAELEKLFTSAKAEETTAVWFVASREEAKKANEFKKLPLMVKGVKVVVGDCTTHSDLCKKWVAVDKLPVVIAFKKTGGFEINYGKNEAVRDVAAFIRESVKSPMKTLTPEMHAKAMESTQEMWLIDYFAPRLLPELRKVHSILQEEEAGDLHIGTIDCVRHKELCVTHGVSSYPTTIFYFEGKSFKSIGSHSADGILDFIENSLHPSVEELTPEQFKEQVDTRDYGITWVVDFYAPWCGPCQQLAPEYQKAARGVKGLTDKARFGSVDCQAHMEFCRQQRIVGYPTVRLYNARRTDKTDRYNNHHFDYPAQGWRDAASLQRWIQELLPSKVERIGSEFYANVLGSSEPWLVDFYAPWCGHCVQFAPVFSQIADALDGRVKCAKIDCVEWPGICQGVQIRGYPTVRFYPGSVNGERQHFEGVSVQSQHKETILRMVDELLKQRRDARDEL